MTRRDWYAWLMVLGIVVVIVPAVQTTDRPLLAQTDPVACEDQLAMCSIALGRQHAAEETHLAYDDATATYWAGVAYLATYDHASSARTSTAFASVANATATAAEWRITYHRNNYDECMGWLETCQGTPSRVVLPLVLARR